MIPVLGYDGLRVAVLGLGRSGLAAARALRAGGAEPLCWDDGQEARARGEGEGFAPADLAVPEVLAGCAALVVSPGIPHLYPAPHPVVLAALAAGVPVDNDIGLLFRSLGRAEWGRLDVPPRVVAVTGSNGKSTTAALIHHVLGVRGGPRSSRATSGGARSTSTRRGRGAWWCSSSAPTRPSSPGR